MAQAISDDRDLRRQQTRTTMTTAASSSAVTTRARSGLATRFHLRVGQAETALPLREVVHMAASSSASSKSGQSVSQKYSSV